MNGCYLHMLRMNWTCVSKIIYDLKRGKAPDISGLTAEHLNQAHHILPVILSKLFRLCVLCKHAPLGFGHSYIVPLPKVKESFLFCCFSVCCRFWWTKDVYLAKFALLLFLTRRNPLIIIIIGIIIVVILSLFLLLLLLQLIMPLLHHHYYAFNDLGWVSLRHRPTRNETEIKRMSGIAFSEIVACWKVCCMLYMYWDPTKYFGTI